MICGRHPIWSAQYDDEHYSDWESAELKTLRNDELERMRECDWIVLPSER